MKTNAHSLLKVTQVVSPETIERGNGDIIITGATSSLRGKHFTTGFLLPKEHKDYFLKHWRGILDLKESIPDYLFLMVQLGHMIVILRKLIPMKFQKLSGICQIKPEHAKVSKHKCI